MRSVVQKVKYYAKIKPFSLQAANNENTIAQSTFETGYFATPGGTPTYSYRTQSFNHIC